MLRRLESTPVRLRLSMLLVVLAGLAFGWLSYQGLTGRSDAIEQARTETADLVRLQTAQNKLVIADAAAGVDVLLGSRQQMLAPHDYAYALQPAVINIAFASRQADDAYALAVANLRLAQYAGDIEAARTLARLGRPQAATQLTSASENLRAEVLPRLRGVQAASEARLFEDQRAANRGPVLAFVAALLVMLILIAVNWWLTLRTRRIVNLGLGAALVAVAVAAGLSGALVTSSERRVSDVRTSSLRVVGHLVDAREAAFDARATEDLAVVTNTVGSSEPKWRTAMGRARAALAAAAESDPAVRNDVEIVSAHLDRYTDVHSRLVDLAARASREEVVGIAVSPTVEGSVGSFEDVEATSGALLARQVQACDDGWVDAGAHLELAGWLCLLAGLGAAALGWRGLALRLREYA